MGLMDSLKGLVTGSGGDAQQALIMQSVSALLTDKQAGGLPGLVKSFTAGGLGNQVNSWVGTGQNIPVTAQQIESVLGQERIAAVASRVGLPPAALSAGLASMLPVVVDKLTPTGQIPESGALHQALATLQTTTSGRTA